MPAVLACHQCARLCDVGKEQVVGKTPDWPAQAYGLELVREGFVVLAPDANKVGERCDPKLRRPWERCIGERMPDGNWAQDRCCTAPGGTWGPIRWKSCFDVMRAVDFLCQQEQIDPMRIGAIGHSLGADTITWTMPIEPRIGAAAISGGGIVAPEPGFTPYGMPYADLLKAIAPRPFLEVTGHRDYANAPPDDPASVDQRMSKKRSAHDAARAVYAAAGAGEALARFEHDGPHSFPEPGRKAAYAWLKRWLMNG
jgi:dienelactone hydrolase